MPAGWKIFVLSGVCVAGIWLCMLVQSVSLTQDMQERQLRLQELQNISSELQDLQAEHGNLEAYQLEIANRKAMSARLLPEHMDTAELLNYLKQSADISGMKLVELVPGEAEQEKDMAVLPLRLKLSGDYFALLVYLRRLQTGSRFVQIESMELAQKDCLECQLGIRVFAEQI